MSVRVAALSLVIFGFFALAYLPAPPSLVHQHWDSLEYARSCELDGMRAMWGNHPLGHAVQCAVFEIIQHFGYQGRALPVMKLFNGVTAAAAVAALFVMMTAVLGSGILRSAGWAALFGSTYGVWHFAAGTADVYSVSVLLLLVGWGLTIRSFDCPSLGRNLLAGVACGIAMLSHQLNGVVLLVGTIGLLSRVAGHSRRRLITSLGMFSLAATMTAAGGYAVLGMWATGSSSAANLLWWIVGHGHDPTYGRFFSLDGATKALRFGATTLLQGAGLWPIHVLLFVGVISGLVLSVASVRWIPCLPDRLKALALASGLQCLTSWLLIVWWEPTLPGKFWLLTLPSFFMWCELSLAGLRQRITQISRGAWRRWMWLLDVTPLLAGLLLLVGTTGVMLRERLPDEVFERSLSAWVEHSGPGDVLIEGGRLTPYLRFWGLRPGAVELYRMIQASGDSGDRFVKLREVIEQAWRQNRAVLFSPGLKYSDSTLAVVGVTRRQVLDFLDRYPREGPLFEYQEFEGGDRRSVYRLVQRTDESAVATPSPGGIALSMNSIRVWQFFSVSLPRTNR